MPIVNVPAAQDFVNFLTSPTVQNELQNYLPTAVTGDPSGPPFVATANPTISIAAPGIPATYKAGTPVTITGGVVNKELGYPVLDGVPVAVSQVVNGLPVKVAGATATTDASGNFSLTFTPPVNGSYEVTTEAISKVEDPTLTPPFGDILSPSASAPTTVTVDAAITALKARSNGAGVAVFGTVAPGFGHVKGTVTISGRPAGSKKGYKKLATVKLAANDGNFAAAPKLDPGNWQFKAVFADTGQVTTSPAKTVTFKLGAKPKTSVSRDSTKVSGQFVKVPATVKPRAASKGGVVKLLVLKATNPAKPQFNQKDKADVRKGKNTVTLKTKLSGAGHYLLELKYSSNGSTASYTTLRGVTIKSTSVTRPAVRLPTHSKSDHRRPGIFPGRRFALAAAVACLATAGATVGGAALPASAAAATDRPVVSATVFPGSEGSSSNVQVLLSTLNTCGNYLGPTTITMQSASGTEPPQPISEPAWTLGTVLTCGLQIPEADVTAVQVVGGHRHATRRRSSNAQIFDVGQYPGSEGALPTIYGDGDEDQTTYVAAAAERDGPERRRQRHPTGRPDLADRLREPAAADRHGDAVTRRREPGNHGAGDARRDRDDGGRDRGPELGVDVQLDGRRLAAAERPSAGGDGRRRGHTGHGSGL